jgi:hypothetical protein
MAPSKPPGGAKATPGVPFCERILLVEVTLMNTRVTAQIRKETSIDPRTGNKSSFAALWLSSESGKDYGVPHYFSGYEEVGALLKREAGVTHEQLQDRYPAYERGDTVRILLSLESDDQIKNLGFDPSTA